MQKSQKATSNPIQGISTHEPSMLCGRRMIVHPDYVVRANYQGRMLYFCTDSCLNAFRADPELFTCTHSKTSPE